MFTIASGGLIRPPHSQFKASVLKGSLLSGISHCNNLSSLQRIHCQCGRSAFDE